MPESPEDPQSGSFDRSHHDVFISYAQHDKPVADAICAKLESRKIRCWIAPRDIPLAKDFPEAIVEAIEGAQVVILVFSSYANTSPHVTRELTNAVNKARVIIPFRVEDVAPSKSMEYLIGVPHWLDAISPPLDKHIDQLADTVEQFLVKRPEIHCRACNTPLQPNAKFCNACGAAVTPDAAEIAGSSELTGPPVPEHGIPVISETGIPPSPSEPALPPLSPQLPDKPDSSPPQNPPEKEGTSPEGISHDRTPEVHEESPGPAVLPGQEARDTAQRRVWIYLAAAIAAVIILILVLIIALPVIFPSSAPGISPPPGSPAVTGPAATVVMTTEPTQALPKDTELVIEAEKDMTNAKVTVRFSGGGGMGLVQDNTVILTRSDGTTTAGKLDFNERSTEIELQGTRATDRLRVIVTMKSGVTYMIVDRLIPYRYFHES